MGIERIARAVGVTLGPKGRNVIIRQPSGEPFITKDGVTVARSVVFNSQFEDVGARLIRQVASKTNEKAGDGTTTATVLAYSIFSAGNRCVTAGANPMDLKRGIDEAVEHVITHLQSQTRAIDDDRSLESVAIISANGQRSVGLLVAGAVRSVGVHGFIDVLEGSEDHSTWKRYEGWSSQRGCLHSDLLSDRVSGMTSLSNALVLAVNGEWTSAIDMVGLLDTVATKEKGRPLVVVARAFSDDVVRVAALNHRHGHLCGLVTLDADASLDDVAALCGCKPHAPESIVTHSSDVLSLMGLATSVTQTRDDTDIVGGCSSTDREAWLRGTLQRTLKEEERDKLRRRLAKLTGTYGVLRVGGRTEIEVSEVKDRFIDSVNASRNALQHGIVAGGGAALLHASKSLQALLIRDDEAATEHTAASDDHRMGIEIVRQACRLPAKHIADNAGVDGPLVVSNIEEADSSAMGYDAQNDKYVDMFEMGIVDPLAVVRSCIADAASVAGLMITTEASICDYVPSRNQ